MSGIGKPAQPLGRGDSEVFLGERQLFCLVCEGASFGYREVLMNTSGMTFLDLDWANKNAHGIICRSCGYVHTFMGDQVRWRPAE